MQELITDSDERGELRPSIVGVVKDFHYATLHEPIEPLVLFPNYPGGYAMVKIDSQSHGGRPGGDRGSMA